MRRMQEITSRGNALGLITVLSIAIAIRMLTFRFRYLLGYDPYFHLAYVEYGIKNGWPVLFPYAYGPNGVYITSLHPKGLWITPAVIYKLLSPFGVSLYDSFRVTPVIFGVMTIGIVYIAVRSLYDTPRSFLSSFFLATNFGHVFRSTAGYYRGDNYMLFFYSLVLLSISKVMTETSKRKAMVWYSLFVVSMGISSFFWRGYYLVFIFVVSNIAVLALGSFYQGYSVTLKKTMFLSLLSIVSIALAEFLERVGDVNTEWTARIQLVGYLRDVPIMRDKLLLMYLLYLLIPLVIFTVLLVILDNKIKGRYRRSIVVLIALLAVLVPTIGYLPRVEEMLNAMFPPSPIREAVRPTLHDIVYSYGLVFFLSVMFVPHLIKSKQKLSDYLILSIVPLTIVLLFTWTRFIFIASLPISLLAGIGTGMISDLLREGKFYQGIRILMLIVVISLLLFNTYYTTEKTMRLKPLVNDKWVNALSYLRKTSGPNDVVLTWWDRGHWVTYFSKRAPVAQGIPNVFVAKYFLGETRSEDLSKLGVDYVIVSYDIAEEFGPIIETAEATDQGYGLKILKRITSSEYLDRYYSPPYLVIVSKIKTPWRIEIVINPDDESRRKIVVPARVYIEDKSGIRELYLPDPTSDACVYINTVYNYAVIMNEKTSQTLFVKLMFTNNVSSSYKLVYSDHGYIKIYRFIHPNVEVLCNKGKLNLSVKPSGNNFLLELIGINRQNGKIISKEWNNVRGSLSLSVQRFEIVKYRLYANGEILDQGIFDVRDVCDKP